MSTELLDAAVAAAREGAEILQARFRGPDLEVSLKEQNDLVTQADRESEAAIVSELRRRFPRHRIQAEEGGVLEGGDGPHEWLVDPLDGTNNFVRGLPVYCVSVACRLGPELLVGVVLDPEGGNLFTAVRGEGACWNGQPMRVSSRPSLAGAFLATGFPFKAHGALDLYLQAFREAFLRARAVRRCGAAALDLAYTAAGVYDGFFEFFLSPWDLAAGVVLIQEAGGVVSDLDGGEGFLETGNLIAGAPEVHRELLAAVSCYAGEAVLADRIPTPRRVESS
jgi:myo-inositol-1(or 4)-monophosphatase